MKGMVSKKLIKSNSFRSEEPFRKNDKKSFQLRTYTVDRPSSLIEIVDTNEVLIQHSIEGPFTRALNQVYLPTRFKAVGDSLYFITTLIDPVISDLSVKLIVFILLSKTVDRVFTQVYRDFIDV